MKVICWNIKTNNPSNIKTDLIKAELLKASALDQPWVLAILENKSGAADIGKSLQAKLKGSWNEPVDAGGSSYTHESIVLVGGNGCVLIRAWAWTGWHSNFNINVNKGVDDYKAAQNVAFSSRTFRPTTADNHNASLDRIDPKDAEDCRDPVCCTVSDGTHQYRICFVHSPGPQDKPVAKKEYAKDYFLAVVKELAADNFDVIMGDFNLYGSEPESTSSMNINKINVGGTTYQKNTEKLGTSRLDRVYLGPRFDQNSPHWLFGDKQISDHAGVCVELLTARQRSNSLSGGQHFTPPSHQPLDVVMGNSNNNNNNNNNTNSNNNNINVVTGVPGSKPAGDPNAMQM